MTILPPILSMSCQCIPRERLTLLRKKKTASGKTFPTNSLATPLPPPPPTTKMCSSHLNPLLDEYVEVLEHLPPLGEPLRGLVALLHPEHLVQGARQGLGAQVVVGAGTGRGRRRRRRRRAGGARAGRGGGNRVHLAVLGLLGRCCFFSWAPFGASFLCGHHWIPSFFLFPRPPRAGGDEAAHLDGVSSGFRAQSIPSALGAGGGGGGGISVSAARGNGRTDGEKKKK